MNMRRFRTAALLAIVLTVSAAFAHAVDYPKMELTFASYLNPGSPENIAMQWMVDELKKRSDGNIIAHLHEAATIGTEIEIIEQVMSGSIHFAFSGSTVINKIAREYESISIPYLYVSEAHATQSLKGPIGDGIRAAGEEVGLYFGDLIFRGRRQLTSNRRIDTPADLKGLKLRLPDQRTHMIIWASLGTLPTPITSSEIFSSLQAGVVDAQENSITSNYMKGLWEVQKYTILTNHQVDYMIWIISKEWMDSMPQPVQDLIWELSREAAALSSRLSLDGEANLQKEMEDHGMEFVKVDTEAFRAAAADGVAEVTKHLAPWVLDQVQKDLEAIGGK